MPLTSKQVFYIRPDDVRSKNVVETAIVFVEGVEMKYKQTGITRMRGVEYEIYELAPIPRKMSRYLCCWCGPVRKDVRKK